MEQSVFAIDKQKDYPELTAMLDEMGFNYELISIEYQQDKVESRALLVKEVGRNHIILHNMIMKFSPDKDLIYSVFPVNIVDGEVDFVDSNNEDDAISIILHDHEVDNYLHSDIKVI